MRCYNDYCMNVIMISIIMISVFIIKIKMLQQVNKNVIINMEKNNICYNLCFFLKIGRNLIFKYMKFESENVSKFEILKI